MIQIEKKYLSSNQDFLCLVVVATFFCIYSGTIKFEKKRIFFIVRSSLTLYAIYIVILTNTIM